jgi:hypothetical protein
MTSWGFALVEQLVRASVGHVQIRNVDRFDVVDAIDPRSTESATILLSQFPSRSLIQALQASGTKGIVFLDDPVDAVRYVQHTGRSGFLEAVRVHSASTALIGTLTGSCETLVLRRSAVAQPRMVAEAILQFLDLKVPLDQIEIVLAGLGVPAGEPCTLESALERSITGYVSPVGQSAALAQDQIEVVGKVLDGAFAGIAGAEGPSITWPWQSFFAGDRPNEPAAMVVDVTGAARIIYYGPYFHLKQGRWKARVMLGFSDDGTGTPFTLQAFGTHLLGHARVLPKRPGVFAADFTITVDEPEHAIEIRVMSDQGAIEGRLALAQVDLAPED